MKHRTFSAGAGMLLGTLLLAASAASAAEFVSVVKDGVNLRSNPDTNADVLFQLPAGYPLQVIERKDDWINVSDYENDKGWISATLVSNAPHVIVKTERGNIRSGPGTDQPQAGKVVRDVILKKLDQQGDWIKVSHPQLTGWINKQLVWP
jgi:SH3-like domain-containing protein